MILNAGNYRFVNHEGHEAREAIPSIFAPFAFENPNVPFVAIPFAAYASPAMTNKLFTRWLPCATLAAWSSVLLYFYFSGRITAFLIPTFRPYVLIAGVVLAAMAAMFLFQSADAQCCAESECGHPMSRLAAGKVLTFLILLLPITVSAYFSPDGFGKAAIENRGIIMDASALGLAPTREAVSKPVESPLPTNAESTPPGAATEQPSPGDYLQRTPEGHIVAEVLDLLYAAQDTTLRGDFEGKTVELIGQLMPDKTTEGGAGNRFKAVRMFMTCCAADARPVATLVEADPMPDFPEMTWIKITGTATFPTENGRRTAVLKATKIDKSDPPEESMLY
jgi:uncharacterized repeat protein (TIGR03943 family)